MAFFQMKAHGIWTDVELPGCADLKQIGNLILTKGKKPNCHELRFFSDLIRNNWGAGAFRDESGMPIENIKSGDEQSFLKMGHMYVTKYEDDVLRLELFYEYKHLGSRQTRSGKLVNSWERIDSRIEVTLMPLI